MRKILPIFLGLLIIALLSGCAVLNAVLQDTDPPHVGVWVAEADTLRLAGDTTFIWTVQDSPDVRETSGIYVIGSSKIVFATGPSQQFAMVYTLHKDSLTLGYGPDAILFTRRE